MSKSRPQARSVALQALTTIEQEKSYSNLLLNRLLQRYKLPREEAAFTTELVYGTIQRLNTIDYYLQQLLKQKLDKLEPWVRSLLRLSFYQLHFLDKIPDHAAVNEAVQLAKARGHQGIVKLVNAVLRNAIRRKAEWDIPHTLPAAKRIALEYAHPEWMVERFLKQFGESVTKQILYSNNEPPHVSVRVNGVKHQVDELVTRMQGEGVEAVRSSLSPDGILVKHAGNMALSHWYKDGDISIQDESSMLVAPVVDAKPGMKVLDCCAAPGGKAAHIAERMNNEGEVWAGDLHAHKQQLIQQQADRLQLTSIRTFLHDARTLDEKFEVESFDRVLLDAPCSGLGVIRRKPDLKWHSQQDEIAALPGLQAQLLAQAAKLVKPGGYLIYSTCTILEEENEHIIDDFLARHDEFRPDPNFTRKLPQCVIDQGRTHASTVTILPDDFHSDGFFIASLQRTC